jgi:hypothetical protein
MIDLGKQKDLRSIGLKVVEDWERKLTPRLAMELTRRPFNVRTRILNLSGIFFGVVT